MVASREPAETRDHVYGGDPTVAMKVCWYAAFGMAGGRAVGEVIFSGSAEFTVRVTASEVLAASLASPL
jgi:hypothetical protein